MLRVALFLFCVSAALSGCGTPQPESTPVDESAQVVTESKLKGFLNDIAESGTAGSVTEEIRTGISELKQTNADLAGKLEGMLSDLEAADQAGKAADVKRVSKEMAELL